MNTHVWMNHVTRVNKSCHTYSWIMSHIWINQVTGLAHVYTQVQKRVDDFQLSFQTMIWWIWSNQNNINQARVRDLPLRKKGSWDMPPEKLLGDGISTPMILLCLICTIISNKTCILDEYQKPNLEWAGVDNRGQVRHSPNFTKLFAR